LLDVAAASGIYTHRELSDRSGIDGDARLALRFVLLIVSVANARAVMFDAIVSSTALAMGLRNAVVRKLGVADHYGIDLTIAGLAADSTLGDSNPRWRHRRRRTAPVLSCRALVGMRRNSDASAFGRIDSTSV
jgi:hypothetical protein